MTMFLKIIFALVEVELFITMGYCHSTGTELFHTENTLYTKHSFKLN
jgi:hypothetical protein